MTKWTVEKLDKSIHDRTKFSCGAEVLDTYLKFRANKEQRNRLNITYIATFATSISSQLKPIIGYYTLNNSSMKLGAVPINFQKGIPATYDIPSIMLGRLAVDVNYQKKGLGSFLLKNAFTKIIEMSALSGIKYVEVIAKDEKAINFYKKFGFIQLTNANKLLVLPVDTLVKAQE